MEKRSNPAQTERSKMLRGEMYLAIDPELVHSIGGCSNAGIPIQRNCS